MPPIIAASCDFETITDRRAMPASRFVLSAGYVHAVRTAGGHAIILPHSPDVTDEEAQSLLGGCQGLLVTGGDFDVPPEAYGQAPHPLLRTLNPMRTSFEARLVEAAWRLGLPVLGICGGMQLINVLRGGTLFQDVSLWPDAGNHEQAFDRARPGHTVRVAQDSRLSQALLLDAAGHQEVPVNTTHHQAVDRLGQGLLASAWAPDGLVEALESAPNTDFCLGVQWHPEAMADGRQGGIYRAFLQAAAQTVAPCARPSPKGG